MGIVIMQSIDFMHVICMYMHYTFEEKSTGGGLRQEKKVLSVRSGIRTHAYMSRLRPERSALDRSAILTYCHPSRL